MGFVQYYVLKKENIFNNNYWKLIFPIRSLTYDHVLLDSALLPTNQVN